MLVVAEEEGELLIQFASYNKHRPGLAADIQCREYSRYAGARNIFVPFNFLISIEVAKKSIRN